MIGPRSGLADANPAPAESDRVRLPAATANLVNDREAILRTPFTNAPLRGYEDLSQDWPSLADHHATR